VLCDFSTTLNACTEYSVSQQCAGIRDFGIIFFGLNAALWSNFMIFVIIYILCTTKNFELNANVYIFIFLLELIALVNSIVYVSDPAYEKGLIKFIMELDLPLLPSVLLYWDVCK
jgi:hypothetical protein